MVDSKSSSQSQDRGVSFLYMAAAFVIVVAGIRAAESILNPLLLAVFLSVITAPAYFGLIKRNISDWLALLIVIGVLSATLIGVVFFVTGSIASFTSDHQQDHYRDKLQEKRALIVGWVTNLIDFDISSESSEDTSTKEASAEGSPVEDTTTDDSPALAAESRGHGQAADVEDQRSTAEEPDSPAGATASDGGSNVFDSAATNDSGDDQTVARLDDPLDLFETDADDGNATTIAPLPVKTRKSLGEFLYSQFDPGMALSWAASVAGSIGQVLSNVFLILLTVVFILLEVGTFNAKMKNAFVRTEETKARADEIVKSIQHYIVIKTWISLATGILVTLWLIPLRVPHPALWGLLAFFFNYIPNVGSILAAIPAVLIASLESTFFVGGAVAIGFAIINIVIGNFIEPRLMGKGLGLSPLVVFFSLVFWGWVLGPIGMLLSVPLTMTARIALEGFEDTRWLATLMGNAST